MQEIENIKKLARSLNIENVDSLFSNIDAVLENRNEENIDSSSEIKIEEMDPECEFVPFLPHKILKEALCNLFDDLDKNNKKYSISDIQQELSTISSNIENDPFENIDFSVANILNNDNCVKSVNVLIKEYTKTNRKLFELQEEKGKLFDYYFEQLLYLEVLRGKLEYASNSENAPFEAAQDLESLYQTYKDIKEFFEENVLAIYDFIPYNSSKKNTWNKKIKKETVIKVQKNFNINLKNYRFDRSDKKYVNKRNKIIFPIEKNLEELREKLKYAAFITGIVDERKNSIINGVSEGRIDKIKAEIRDYKETDDYLKYVPTYIEIDKKIQQLTRKQNKLREKLEQFTCNDSIQEVKKDFSPGESTQEAPLIVSNTRNAFIPTDKNYWDEWANIATLVNLSQPPQFWPIGIVIPTASGLLKIPMPIIWKSIAVIPNSKYLIVIFLGMCGVCPSPFVFIMDMVQKTTRFLVSLRGPQTIRSVNETTSKIDDNLIQSNNTQFGKFITNSNILQNVPLVEDDLPDFSRLNMKNIPFVLQNQEREGMMVAFNRAGKRGGGFFES